METDSKEILNQILMHLAKARKIRELAWGIFSLVYAVVMTCVCMHRHEFDMLALIFVVLVSLHGVANILSGLNLVPGGKP